MAFTEKSSMGKSNATPNKHSAVRKLHFKQRKLSSLGDQSVEDNDTGKIDLNSTVRGELVLEIPRVIRN